MVAAAVVLATLLIGSIVSTTQAVRATRAERLAQKRLEETQAVNDFLTQDMIGAADPAVHRGRAMTVLEALDNAARALESKFRDRPLTQATVRASVASAYVNLGNADLALPHATQALELRRRVLGDDHPDTITALEAYASVVGKRGSHDEAERLFRQALEQSRRVNGEDHLQSISLLNGYANMLTFTGKFAEAQALRNSAGAGAAGPGRRSSNDSVHHEWLCAGAERDGPGGRSGAAGKRSDGTLVAAVRRGSSREHDDAEQLRGDAQGAGPAE